MLSIFLIPSSIKMKAKLKAVQLEALGYCSRSSVHGLSYISYCTRLPERVFWVVIVSLATIYASFLVAQTYQDWKDNPISTDVESLTYDIRSIQYPAITVCPPEKVEEWNLPRIWLNLFPFKCDNNTTDAAACGAANSIRRDFKEFLEELPKFMVIPEGYTGTCLYQYTCSIGHVLLFPIICLIILGISYAPGIS